MIHRALRLPLGILFVLICTSLGANAKLEALESENPRALACREAIFQTEKKRSELRRLIESQHLLPPALQKWSLETLNHFMLRRLKTQVGEYLLHTGTRFEIVNCRTADGGVESAFAILPSSDGSWLNQSAKILNLFWVNLRIQPEILKHHRDGHFHVQDREIVLALPPWLESFHESLTHEAYHALMIHYSRSYKVHLLGGISRAEGDLALYYPQPDWSEIGAYLQTLVSRIEVLKAAEVGTTVNQAQLYRQVNNFLLFLQQLPENFNRVLDSIVSHPPGNLELVESEEGKILSLRLVDGEQTDLFIFAFFHKNSLNLENRPGAPLGKNARVWNFHDLAADDQELVLERLHLLSSLFRIFHDEVTGILSAYEPQASSEVWAQRMLALRPLLHALNKHWVTEFLPEDNYAYEHDDAVDSVIEVIKHCQRLLR